MARGGALNLVGAAVAAVAIFGVTVLVTRQFSKAVAGAFFTATSAFLVVEGIATLGSNVGLVYFIARLRSLGEDRRIPTIFRAAVVPVIVASMAAAAILLACAAPLSRLLVSGQSGGGAGSAAVAVSLRALAVALPFAALTDTFLGASRGYRNMRPTVIVDRIGRSVGQLAGIVIAAAASSAAFLAPLWALPYIPAAALSWLWLRRVRRASPGRFSLPEVPPELAVLLSLSTPVPPPGAGYSQGPRQSGGRIAQRKLANANPRGFWQFTAPRAIANFAAIVLQRLDIMLVAILRGPAAAAVYTAATRFLVAGQFGNVAISMAAQPRFTELFTLGDRRNANVIYQVTTAWLVLLTWPLYLLAIVYGPELLTVFGHSYRAGNVVMVVLGFASLLSTACGQVDMVLITTGRSSWSLVNGLLATGLNVGLDIILIPRWGITGAAVGWAAAIVVANLVPLAQLSAVVRLHPFGRETFVAIGLSATSFCLIPLLIRAVAGDGIAGLTAGVAAGCAAEAVGLWFLRDVLQLSAMPGVSLLRARRRRGRHPAGHGHGGR